MDVVKKIAESRLIDEGKRELMNFSLQANKAIKAAIKQHIVEVFEAFSNCSVKDMLIPLACNRRIGVAKYIKDVVKKLLRMEEMRQDFCWIW